MRGFWGKKLDVFTTLGQLLRFRPQLGDLSLGQVLRFRPQLGDLSRIFRLRLRLHLGWLAAFILITAMVVTQFPEDYAFWQRIVLGVIASLLFFTAVSIREIILNFLALSRGMPMRRVTLFIFGGVSPVAEGETFPMLELLMALAGMLINLIITGILYAVYSILVGVGAAPFDGLILWLVYLYFLLTLFHFFPVLPLDGGRLFRALLWRLTGNYDLSTAIFSWGGEVVGLVIIAWGLLLLFWVQEWFNGLALVFIGWFLHDGAIQSRRRMVLHRNLRGIMARHVMTREYPVISRSLSLTQLVRTHLMAEGQRYFIVADGNKLEGIVTLSCIKGVPRKSWSSTTIGEIMVPVKKLRTARAGQSVARLLEQMNEGQFDHMPVLERNKVIGILVRDRLMRLVKTQKELR